MDPNELQHRFTFHAPDAAKAAVHAATREDVAHLANILNERLPEGREKSLVMTHLEESMFWANAAIARAEP